ncbi:MULTISPECIES: hypothetical protein [Lysinibacillus]|nr:MULTISPECIES: hypothetical protein [Lysinibacillus]
MCDCFFVDAFRTTLKEYPRKGSEYPRKRSEYPRKGSEYPRKRI